MTHTVHRLERTQLLERPVEDVFAFYSDAANLEAITPPFLRFRILTPTPIAMGAGTRIEYALSLYGVPIRWRTLITRWELGVCFVDEQESGPYALWRHTHTFEPRGNSTLMRDVVEYREPFGALGQLAHVLAVRRTLERIFDYRRDATGRLLGRSARPGSAAIDASTRPAHAFDIEVYYDGACPMCAREIAMLRRLDRAGRISFVDIAGPGFDAAAVGVSQGALVARIHGRLPDGTLIDGVEVFRRLYTAVGFGPVVALTRLPGVAQLLDATYAGFARRRLRLGGRCDAQTCAPARAAASSRRDA